MTVAAANTEARAAKRVPTRCATSLHRRRSARTSRSRSASTCCCGSARGSRRHRPQVEPQREAPARGVGTGPRAAARGLRRDRRTRPERPGAYYLLRQRRLIGPSGAFVAEEMVDAPRDLAQTWSYLFATWRLWRKLAQDGTALALGLPEAVRAGSRRPRDCAGRGPLSLLRADEPVPYRRGGAAMN